MTSFIRIPTSTPFKFEGITYVNFIFYFSTVRYFNVHYAYVVGTFTFAGKVINFLKLRNFVSAGTALYGIPYHIPDYLRSGLGSLKYVGICIHNDQHKYHMALRALHKYMYEGNRHLVQQARNKLCML